VRIRFVALAMLILTILAPAMKVPAAQAQTAPLQPVSCRNYADTLRPSLRPRLEALRRLEREADDRLRGLDTRTYPFLAGEASKQADLIADAKMLDNEEAGTKACRNAVPMVRAMCRAAALAFAAAIDDEEKGEANKDNRKAYGEAMGACEQSMGLGPLNTPWRGRE
jgi:hypothetical protein